MFFQQQQAKLTDGSFQILFIFFFMYWNYISFGTALVFSI